MHIVRGCQPHSSSPFMAEGDPTVPPLSGGAPQTRTPRRQFQLSARTPRSRQGSLGSVVSEGSKPWLFSLPGRAMTTADICAMGFCRAVIMDADEWSTEPAALEVISDAFRLRTPLAELSSKTKGVLMAAMRTMFTGDALGGDLLVIIRMEKLASRDPDDEQLRTTFRLVGRVVDALSSAWEAADGEADSTLSAMIVVLEGFKLPQLSVDWGSDDPRRPLMAVPLENDLSNFFVD